MVNMIGPIPQIGFGTWKRSGDEGYREVLTALEVGYRAFGEVACTTAAREGISAFEQRRAPDFGATG